MAEEQNIKDEAAQKTPTEGGKKDLNPREQFKKLKNRIPKNPNNFNFYWIYIVILVGLALMWFPNFTDNTQRIEWPDFVENVLKPGDIKKIVIVNEQTAEIYIKTDRLKDAKYDKVRERPITKEINPCFKRFLGIKYPEFDRLVSVSYFNPIDNLREIKNIEQCDYSQAGW